VQQATRGKKALTPKRLALGPETNFHTEHNIKFLCILTFMVFVSERQKKNADLLGGTHAPNLFNLLLNAS
jgi:hypothetical protein